MFLVKRSLSRPADPIGDIRRAPVCVKSKCNAESVEPCPKDVIVDPLQSLQMVGVVRKRLPLIDFIIQRQIYNILYKEGDKAGNGHSPQIIEGM